MVLKRFAAVAGSADLAALQDTGRKSGSPPLPSLPHSKLAAANLDACHKARIGPVKLTHILPSTAKLFKASQPDASHWHRLSSWVVIWQELRNHLCVCWSQPRTERRALLLSTVCVIHHRTLQLCFLGLLSSSGVVRSMSEWVLMNPPVVNLGRNNWFSVQVSAESTSSFFWGPWWWRWHLRCFNPE